MGKLIVSEFLSLDGRFEGPPGAEMDWVHRGFSPQLEEGQAQRYANLRGLVMGRRTFEVLGSYWPTPAAQEEHLFEQMNSLPKLVVSHREDVGSWQNSRHLGEDPLESLRRERSGGDPMVIGSRSLVQQLAETDMIDEYQLLLFPEVLGTGELLFPDQGPPADFTLSRTETFPNDVLVLHYTRNRDNQS